MKSRLSGKSVWALGLPLFLGLCFGGPFCFGQDVGAGPNSTRKIRTRPSSLSVQVGSGVGWVEDYSEALAQSKATGRPIFWYVPSIRGTFMDRQAEVDRYMMAGPFSWPATIRLLNEKFIPLKAVPVVGNAERYGLQVYKFVEPGFLVLDSNAEPVLVANRLTTLHPKWIFDQIASTLDDSPRWSDFSDPGGVMGLDHWFQVISDPSVPVAEESLNELRGAASVELRLLAGMLLHRMGRQAEAIKVWEETAKAFPTHPLGWKASCESQRLGPFVRGFEVFGNGVDQASLPKEGKFLTSTSTSGRFAEEALLWTSGVQFLLTMQDESGAFRDSDYDFGGTDSLPNVHVAVTSLVGLALIDASEKGGVKGMDGKVRAAIHRAIEFVSDEKSLNLNDRDEILWAEAYRVRLLAQGKQKGFEGATLERLQVAVDQLQSLQMNSGSWFHEYANAFVTATALLALNQAKLAGAKVDEGKVQLGLERLESQRYGNGAYPYATRVAGRKDAGTDQDLKASGGRVSVCELARRAWLKIGDDELGAALDSSFKYHDLLETALKYDDHTTTFAYGGFFFWYDMQARSEAIGMLAPGPERDGYAQRQRELVLALPEIDGCFVDSHELGRCYGTAMGLLSLGSL